MSQHQLFKWYISLTATIVFVTITLPIKSVRGIGPDDDTATVLHGANFHRFHLKDGTTFLNKRCVLSCFLGKTFFIREELQMSKRLITSESITEGHPDKVCDKIADSILDALLAQDPLSRVAVEVAINLDTIFVFGQITTNAKVDYDKVVKNTIKEIGYNATNGFDVENCKIIYSLEKQSPDIAMGVDSSCEYKSGGQLLDLLGAGDQGIMFGYACDETDNLMPLAADLANKLAYRLQQVRKEGILTYLRPDGKTQVTVQYDDGKPVRVATVVVSTQHNPEISQEQLAKDVIQHVVKPVIDEKLLVDTQYLINPTGQFVLGGPGADSGLTGRKLIVDTYGGYCPHGGGAFSGKDPTKVDRSASYMARFVAKNLVASKLCKKAQIHLSYAIGKAQPVSVDVDTFGTGLVDDDVLAQIVKETFDFRPLAIINGLNLRQPIYSQNVNYSHFGKDTSWEQTSFVGNLVCCARKYGVAI